ncbi:MAG TPA: efflux RND transporter periplasmic adaptor subunit, partial [Gemmatimonadales bacterium]
DQRLEDGRTAQDLRDEIARLRLLRSITEEFSTSLDFDELLPKVFNAVLDAVGARGGSLWMAEGEVLRCRLALGAASQKLLDTTVPIGEGFVGDVARKQRTTIVNNAMADPRFRMETDRSSTMITTNLMVSPMITKGITVGSIQVTNKVGGLGIFDDHDREVLEGLAASAAAALRNAQLHTAEKRARDLAILLEISREITSTLDLDRILQLVVNLAARPLTFDRGAIGLVRGGRCTIRALAGQDDVPDTDDVRRLAARGAWAADRGVRVYLADREAPRDDVERALCAAFGDDLAGAGVRGTLYLPLRDEEGTLGVLLFESQAPDFVTDTQLELAEILANQTTVALRNAELYHQVPLIEALGSIGRTRRRLLEVPRRRRQAMAVAAVGGLAALTVIRWPFRVAGVAPTFRAVAYADVRPLVPGLVEQVLVREGQTVAQGTPLIRLRDADWRAERGAAAAAASAAERAAAVAASQGNAAGERIQRARLAALERQLALLDEQLAATVVRAPVTGAVLTPRPEELVGAWRDEGDVLVTMGRTDTLELEFGVPQRDLPRVRVGQRVRLRVDALPQRTFEGTVTQLGALPAPHDDAIAFPVRALVPNPDERLRPGMVAHAKVLTDPTSVLGRVVRAPLRRLRLAWWRLRW